jgi:hypothetical protein
VDDPHKPEGGDMRKLKAVAVLFLVFSLCFFATGCDNLTQENYNKIKVGMSFQEVEKLLGSGPTCDSAVGMKNCTWGSTEKHVKVQFVADKVALYSAKGLK